MKATAGMSIRRRKFITNAIYDKHWNGGNLAHLNLPEVDTCHAVLPPLRLQAEWTRTYHPRVHTREGGGVQKTVAHAYQ